MKKHIPNLLTLANLFCGCCSLVMIFQGKIGLAACFTAGCFFFDYLDGMAARAFNVSSPIGKELDSLADVVSFGVVPGALFFHLLGGRLGANFSGGEISGFGFDPKTLSGFVLSAFSALRLAKFNVDTRQTAHFIGLSTPACTMFVLGLALAADGNQFGLRQIIENQWLLFGLIGLLSWLLVSEIPMFGMKIKSSDLKNNWLNLAFAALFLVFVFTLKFLSLSAIIVCYVLASIFLFEKKLV